MRRNFDMDAAIRRALRESIEAHAHEWEPKFKTGVGPVGDDAPFDKKVSGDVNEGKDCEECCPKCGKCPCECDKVNEGTIPGDSHEWEPDFKTGVGPVGDDNPFTQAVNEAFVEGGDWEKDSFGASDHKKEGISFADGGDECQNGVVATGQKNSGEVVSSDNLSEGKDDEGEDEIFGLSRREKNAKAGGYTWDPNKSGKENRAARKEMASAYANFNNSAKMAEYGNVTPQETDNVKTTNTITGNGIQPGSDEQPKAQMIQPKEQPEQPKEQPEQPKEQPEQPNTQQGGMSDSISKADLQQWMQNHAGEQDKNGAWENLWQFVTGKAQLQESKEEEKDVIAEERDRFFNIINRIEKLYD